MKQQIMVRRMNHTYIASTVEQMAGRCAVCRRPEVDHTTEAKCDHCKMGEREVFLWADILLCQECVDKQDALQQHIADTADERVRAARLLVESRKLDQGIRVFTDVFNSKTVGIEELRAAIFVDDTIPQDQKRFKFAAVLDERYQKLKDVIFSKRDELSQLETEQRAIQVYYNNFANQLKTEERAQLRLKDSTYVVQEPKKVTTPKAVTAKPYDKVSIRTTAAKHKLPEAAINMLCVAKNISPEEAARIMLASMASAAKAKEEANG